jgi:hypothetical protein
MKMTLNNIKSVNQLLNGNIIGVMLSEDNDEKQEFKLTPIFFDDDQNPDFYNVKIDRYVQNIHIQGSVSVLQVMDILKKNSEKLFVSDVKIIVGNFLEFYE